MWQLWSQAQPMGPLEQVCKKASQGETSPATESLPQPSTLHTHPFLMHVSCDGCSVGMIRGDKRWVEVTGADLWYLLMVPSGPGGVADPGGGVEATAQQCTECSITAIHITTTTSAHPLTTCQHTAGQHIRTSPSHCHACATPSHSIFTCIIAVT